MEGFHDVVRHTHKFIIRGGRVHALCREVTNGPCDIPHTKQEHCQSTPGEVFQGERFPSSKLRHDGYE